MDAVLGALVSLLICLECEVQMEQNGAVVSLKVEIFSFRVQPEKIINDSHLRAAVLPGLEGALRERVRGNLTPGRVGVD